MINRIKILISFSLLAITIIGGIGCASCSKVSAEETSIKTSEAEALIGEWVAKGSDGCMSFEFCKDGTALFRETGGDIYDLKNSRPVLYDYEINENRITLTIEGGHKIQKADYSVKGDGKILILKFDGDRHSIKLERQ